MLEEAITHSAHAVHQPSPPAHRHSSVNAAHSGDLIEISAHANNEVHPDTTVEREPPQTSLQTDFHPQSAAYQAYSHQQNSYNAGTAQPGSSLGQGHTRSLPMHHCDPPTTSDTSTLRCLTPPFSPTSYSHPSHKQHSSRSITITPARRALSVESDVTSVDPSESEDVGLPREWLVPPFRSLRELADWADAVDERNEVSFSFGVSLFFYSWNSVPLSPEGRINRKAPHGVASFFILCAPFFCISFLPPHALCDSFLLGDD